jgi:hypothetical protein
VSHQNLTSAELEELERAGTIREVTTIALKVLHRMRQPIIDVCGPISTGGLGHIDKNLKVFRATIQKLCKLGHSVFDLVPYEDAIKRIRDDLEARHSFTKEQSEDIILYGFYLPLFESGLIKRLAFMPGWDKSRGASWERKIASWLGIPIEDLCFNNLGIDLSQF